MKNLLVVFILSVLFSHQTYALDDLGPQLEFKGVTGHIDVAGSSLDTARLAVEIKFTCYKGWGDGQHQCGSVQSKVPVDTNGDFYLAPLKGTDPNYFGFTYNLFLDGQVLIGSTNRVQNQSEINQIQNLFKSMTLVIFEPFQVGISALNGQDFFTWNKTINKSSSQYFSVHFESRSGQGFGPHLPEMYMNYVFDSIQETIPVKYFLFPGSKNQLAQDYLVNVKVESCYSCNFKSLTIYDKTWPLDIPAFLKNVANLELDTDKINIDIDGTWDLSFEMSFFDPNGRYFIHTDPKISMQAKCQNGSLVGTIFYQYIRKNGAYAHLNRSEPLLGSCAKGEGKASVHFMMLNNDLYTEGGNYIAEFPFDGYFIFEDVRGNGLTLKYQTPNGKSESESGIRCVNGFAKDLEFNHCP